MAFQFISQSVQEPEIYDLYWANEQKCRRITDLIVSYIFYNQLTFAAALFYAFYNVWAGNLDTSTYFLPFSMDIPLNTKVIAGWLVLWLIQFNMSLAYITCMVTITSYFVSCCFYIDTICTHFDCIIESNRQKSGSKQGESVQDDEKQQRIHEAIRLHINLFE